MRKRKVDWKKKVKEDRTTEEVVYEKVKKECTFKPNLEKTRGKTSGKDKKDKGNDNNGDEEFKASDNTDLIVQEVPEELEELKRRDILRRNLLLLGQ